MIDSCSLRRLTALCFVALVGAPLFAADSVYRHIRSIEIEAQAKSVDGASTDVCRNFKLSKAVVRDVLKTSLEVDVRTYAHDLYVAPCRIEGRLSTSNGLTATWEITMSGAARIVFDDGRVMLLDCRKCSKAPFAR
jgi:hypothetical protein